MPNKPQFPMYVQDQMAVDLAGAAYTFAMMARALETDHPFQPDPEPQGPEKYVRKGLQRKLVRLSAASVIMAVAGWEARLNSLLHLTDDATFRAGSKTWRALPDEARQHWPALWRDEVNKTRKLQLLDKSREALRLAGMEPIKTGEGIGQAFAILVNLRDALVHSKPALRRHGRNVPQRELDPLEVDVRNRFSPSSLAGEHEPYLWRRCLGAGCARWAVNTAEGYAMEFRMRLGVPVSRPDPL